MKKIFQLLQLKFRGYLVIDNFFPEEVALNLRKLALSQYCVNEIYPDGYKASDFDNESIFKMDSRCISLVVKKLPILKNTEYFRSWSFVYENVCRGVGPHADPSVYNVNIWVTPTDSVEDCQKNGIILFKKFAHPSMTWEQYNSDINLIEKYLKDSKRVKIPYRFNRAVIFPGKMFHTTDFVHMKPGDWNKRINYTFLFK